MSKAWNKTSASLGRNSTSGSTPKYTRHGNFEYCVMVLSTLRIRVFKRNWTTNQAWGAGTDISAVGLMNVSRIDDSHCDLALCVDGAGYVHVIGNTHGNAMKHIRTVNPFDITSWQQAEKPAVYPSPISQQGIDQATYNYFLRYSDGEIAWFGVVQDILIGGQNVMGRDWYLFRLTPANAVTQTWVPAVPTQHGKLTTVLSVSEGNVEEVDNFPDRTYIRAAHIDEFDVLHAHVSFRMEDASGAATESGYMRSFDRGQTWVNINNQHVNVPLAANHRIFLDGGSGTAAARVRLADNSLVGSAVTSNIVIDSSGNPHWCCSDSSFSGFTMHVWYDGTNWNRERCNTYNNWEADLSTLSRVGDDIWIWTYDSEISDAGLGVSYGNLRGTNINLPTAKKAMGLVTKGTPGDVYTFENGAQFWPSEPYSGGLTEDGRHVTRFFIPDGDVPMVRSIGDGPKFKQ